MADTLILKGTEECVTLFKPRDLVDYVRRYMGDNTADYVLGLINNLEEIRDAVQEIYGQLDTAHPDDMQHALERIADILIDY